MLSPLHTSRLVALASLTFPMLACDDPTVDEVDEEAIAAEMEAPDSLVAGDGAGESAAVTVNPVEFMRNTSATKRLLLDASQSEQAGGACTPEVSYTEKLNIKNGDLTHNIFYYVKAPGGKLYEMFNFDGEKVWLERDTSWPAKDAGGASAGYDGKPWGSFAWATNGWAEGAPLQFTTWIAGFIWDPNRADACEYETGAPNTQLGGYETIGHKQYSYHPAKWWGGAVGTADSIAIDSYVHRGGNNGVEKLLSERHWYARGKGWVGWERYNIDTAKREQRCVWNIDGGAPTAPVGQCTNLNDRVLPFLDKSTQMATPYGDWDFCYNKAACRIGLAVQGLSRVPGGAHRNAMCASGNPGVYNGNHAATLRVPGDQRRATRSIGGSTDWDFGRWKLECGTNEYVAGVSQGAAACATGEGEFHGLVCATAGVSLSNTCTTRTLNEWGGDDRGTLSSGDWDVGGVKAECGHHQYLAGVSVDTGTRKVHRFLCCNR